MSELNYLEKLLDGVEVEWIRLGNLVRIKNGKDHKSLGEGDFPVYGSGGVMRYADTYAYDKPSVLIPRKGSLGNLFFVDVPFWTVDTIFYTIIDETKIWPKYLYYFLTTVGLGNMNQAGGVPSQTQSVLNELKIPIPCPSNPEKSLAIQSEIVRILDKFTALTAELTAELTARKKQYNYYRDQLLSFDDEQEKPIYLEKLLDGVEVEWKPLREVCDFKNGFAFKSNLFKETGLPIVRITNIDGFNVNLDEVKYFSPNDYKEDISSFEVSMGDIVIAMSGATTGKVGFYKNETRCYLNQRVGKFVPKRNLLNNKYLYHFLLLNTEAIYILAGGGAQPNLSSNALMSKLLIPIPSSSNPEKSLAIQAEIVRILDKFDTLTNSITEGLPREIELRQKQYEYYRDLLFSFPKPDSVTN